MEKKLDKRQAGKGPSLLLALCPVLFLMALLIINVNVFGDNSTGGPNQLALFVSALVTLFLGVWTQNVDYEEAENTAVNSILYAMQANLILLSVGTLIGIWILAGIVPTMIFYGVKLMSPEYFLVSTCAICCMVSLSTGSSWSTGGTVGVALIGVGKTLGIPLEMVAGAIISGAYFGDKMSPLSDTTNLAPAMAGSNLFEHIRYMLITTVPAIIMALILFFFLGLQFDSAQVTSAEIENVLNLMESQFNISPLLFLAPATVLFLVYKKVPALPSMLIGSLVGVVLALVFQGNHVLAKAETGLYETVVSVAVDGYKSNSGNEFVDSLFSRGGMSSMLSTVWLIIVAMFFGGAMEATGFLGKLASSLLSLVRGTGSLVASTLGSCVFLNLTASDQFLSIVVAGRMFREAYQKFGLAPVNLSRTLEDGGTVTSVLVPWNSGGAYFSSILGVGTFAYLPYCFFNLLSPIVSAFVAGFRIKVKKLEELA